MSRQHGRTTTREQGHPKPPSGAGTHKQAKHTESTVKLEHDGELTLLDNGDNPVIEKFLRLKTKLSHGQLASFKTLIITSPIPGDGKSTVSMNLALAFATNVEAPTILVDCDLRRPSVRQWMRPFPKRDLMGVLNGEYPLTSALCRVAGSNLHILPTTRGIPDPVETLTSSRFAQLLSVIKQSYARVILDTPPIVPFPDADALGSLADGIIMVVRSRKTPKHLYLRALESLHSAPILGTVLNGSSKNFLDKGHYEGSYYYDYYRKKR